MKLFQGLRITEISSRFSFTFRTHCGYAKCCHVVSDFCALTGGIGDIYIVVEDSHGECELGEFPVVHDHIRLESAVFRRTHTWEVYAVFRFPVMFL